MNAPPAGGRGPWLAFAGCGAIWGSTFLFIAIGNDSLPPLWAAGMRLGLAGAILALLTRLVGHPFPRGAALRAAALYGAFQFGINFPLLYWGEQYISSGLTAVLFATIPLSTALITRAFGMERLNALKITGALVALAGVALIGGGSAGDLSHRAGAIAVIVAATFGGLGTTFLKRGPRQSPFAANAVGCAVGLPICLAASALAGERWAPPATAEGWTSLLYLVLLGSVGAFALLAWLLQHWPVTRVAFISVVTPVIALVLGAVFRDEAVTGRSLAGTGLVLAGLVLGMTADRRRAGRPA